MKIRNYKQLLLISFLCVSLSSCAKEKKTKIGVFSDTHYLSEQLMDNGEAVNKYVQSSARDVISAPQLLEIAIEDFLKNEIEVVLIPGDLTKDGEEQSHKELISKLQILRQKGIKVFVVPGNHDINIPNAKGYKGNESYNVKNISPKEFENLYQDFGYAQAIEQDNASLSYTAELDENTWLIAIDGCQYEDYTAQSLSGGRIKPATEQWIEKILKKAAGKNKKVVGMMHHSLVEHIMYHEMVFPQFIIDDWKRLANKFADGGMKAIFTGHMHANDITEFTSTKGNKIYDIETGALLAYPFPYRMISMDNQGMEISTKNILSTPKNPNLVENNKIYLRQVSENIARNKLQSFGFKFPTDIVDNIAKLAGELLLLHVAGDEVVTDDLRKRLKELSELTGQEAPGEEESFQLDFFPADNNLRIEFNK